MSTSTGKVPSSAFRRDAFGDPGAFETAAGRTKDRFFLQEMPIRIEYKDVGSMNNLVAKPMEHLKLLKNSGTYSFFRLKNNKVIYKASEWIEETRLNLENFPDTAWEALLDSFSAKMEHYLSDMGAASFSGDKFFLLLSEAGFLRYAAASLFMVNKQFEPSHRDIEEHLHGLSSVPEGFLADMGLSVAERKGNPRTEALRNRQAPGELCAFAALSRKTLDMNSHPLAHLRSRHICHMAAFISLFLLLSCSDEGITSFTVEIGYGPTACLSSRKPIFPRGKRTSSAPPGIRIPLPCKNP